MAERLLFGSIMNIYFWVILIALIVIHLIDTISQFLNLKSITSDLPEEFIGVYDPSEYKRSKEYTQIQIKFEIIDSSFDLVLLLVFWLVKGFNWLDIWIRSFGYHQIVNGLIYFGMLLIIKMIFSIPFDIYSTFVIEEKFGFNKTTIKTFVIDRIKSIFLIILLGGIVITGLLAFFLWAGPFAWLYGWCAVTIFAIILQFVAPIWIMPLFNKFIPLDDGELKTAILNYTNSVQFPLQGLFVIDGSKRSSKSNAFFTGFGKNKRIALFDTLIEKHTVKELVTILAHEIGHYKKKHILKSMIISIAEMGIFFFLFSFFINEPKIYSAFFIENMSIYTGLLLFVILYSPISFILSLFTQFYSRQNEDKADNFAIETTHDAESLITSLKKLAVTNLANLTPHPFYVFLHYSHPPLIQRIANMRKF